MKPDTPWKIVLATGWMDAVCEKSMRTYGLKDLADFMLRSGWTSALCCFAMAACDGGPVQEFDADGSAEVAPGDAFEADAGLDVAIDVDNPDTGLDSSDDTMVMDAVDDAVEDAPVGCQTDCELKAYDEQVGIVALALDETHVFYATNSFEIRRISKSGGEKALLYKADVPLRRILVNHEYVFAASGTTILRMLKSGGAAIELVQFPYHDEMGDIALHGSTIYFNKKSQTGGGIYTIEIGGGSPVQISAVQFASFYPKGLGLSDTHVYWTNGIKIEVAPLEGGEADVVDIGESGNQNVIADSKHITWTNSNGLSVIELATGVKSRFSSGDGGPLALDAKHVYWAAPAFSMLHRTRLGTETVETVETVATTPHISSLAGDATHLYWGSNSSGEPTLHRIGK